MDELNPYAAPQADISPVHVHADSLDGLWRDGPNLVMLKDAALPSICVKSGVATNRTGILRKLTWRPRWIVCTLLFGLVVYVLLSLVLTKRCKIHIPLCEVKRTERRRRLLVWWTVGLAGLSGLVGSTYLVTSLNNDVAFVGLIGLLVSFIALITGLLAGQATSLILSTKKITDTHIWLRGVHESILERLPPLPPM